MRKQLLELIKRYPVLEKCEKDIVIVYESLIECFAKDNRLYVLGNGGSASDSLHIVSELAKSFNLQRTLDDEFEKNVDNSDLCSNLQGALPVFALVENASLSTAYANDCNPDYVFAQQVYAYARKEDCVLAISTSGNSKNVLLACETARARGAKTIAFTGENGGRLKEICDMCICVPEEETYKIQELHLPIYHTLCLMIEEYFWGENGIWKQ